MLSDFLLLVLLKLGNLLSGKFLSSLIGLLQTLLAESNDIHSFLIKIDNILLIILSWLCYRILKGSPLLDRLESINILVLFVIVVDVLYQSFGNSDMGLHEVLVYFLFSGFCLLIIGSILSRSIINSLQELGLSLLSNILGDIAVVEVLQIFERANSKHLIVPI